MIGINKVTPSRAVKPVQPSSNNQARKAPREPVKSTDSKDNAAEIEPSVRRIDERI